MSDLTYLYVVACCILLVIYVMHQHSLEYKLKRMQMKEEQRAAKRKARKAAWENFKRNI